MATNGYKLTWYQYATTKADSYWRSLLLKSGFTYNPLSSKASSEKPSFQSDNFERSIFKSPRNWCKQFLSRFCFSGFNFNLFLPFFNNYFLFAPRTKIAFSFFLFGEVRFKFYDFLLQIDFKTLKEENLIATPKYWINIDTISNSSSVKKLKNSLKSRLLIGLACLSTVNLALI